ncbi:MAG: hypothetical protein RBJ76_05930 [Stenomitos frigidus ULC029]
MGYTLVMGEDKNGIEAVAVKLSNETTGKEVLIGYDCSLNDFIRVCGGIEEAPSASTAGIG